MIDENAIISRRQWQNRFRSIRPPYRPPSVYSVVCPANDGKFYVKATGGSIICGYIAELGLYGCDDRYHTNKEYVRPRTHRQARVIANMKNAECHELLIPTITERPVND